MPDMIIFGAGASFGSDILYTPPLAKDLIDELISFQPHTWGKIESSLIRLFKRDFEKGMEKLSEENPRSLDKLQRAMAEYFFRFAPAPDNLYRKLARRIQQSGWHGVLATCNYERLLELSLIFEGLQPVTGEPQAPEQIELCLPHGCCHLFCKAAPGSSSPISSNGKAIKTKGQVRPVFEPDQFRNRISNSTSLPVMNYFEPQKGTTSGRNFITAQRKRFKEAVLNSSRIAIIGLKVRPRDEHIWDSLAQTPATLVYCSREAAAKRFKNWAKKYRSAKNKVFDGNFDEHFDDICNKLNIAPEVLLTTLEAKLRAEAQRKVGAYAEVPAEGQAKAESERKTKAEAERETMAYTKALEEARVKAEFEARSRVEAEDKIRAYGEALARIQEKTTAEAEARAKAQQKIKSHDEEIVQVKTDAADTLAEVKADFEEKLQLYAAQARQEAEAKADAYSAAIEEAQAKAESEARLRAEAERTAKGEAKAKARAKRKAQAQAQLRAEAQRKTQSYAEEIAKVKAKAADRLAKVKAEFKEKLRLYLEDQQLAEAKAESVAKLGAEAEEKAAAEAKAKTDEADTGRSKEQLISETIRKMAQSPTELPGQAAVLAMTEKAPLSSTDGTLSGIYAKDIMQKEPPWASPDDSVQQALAKMQRHDTSYLMIGRNEVYEGIVSKSDLLGAVSPYLRGMFAKWRRPRDDATLHIKVKWVMSRPVHTTRPETSLATIMEKMRQFGGRCLPVVDQQGKVQGLVTVFDIFTALLKSKPDISTAGKTLQAPPLLVELKAPAKGQKLAAPLDTPYVPC